MHRLFDGCCSVLWCASVGCFLATTNAGNAAEQESAVLTVTACRGGWPVRETFKLIELEGNMIRGSVETPVAEFLLSPGSHRMRFHVLVTTDIGARYSFTPMHTFTAQQGHTYSFSGTTIAEQDHSWIEDIDSGELVSGTKFPWDPLPPC